MKLPLANKADWLRLKDYVSTLPWQRGDKAIVYLVSIDEVKSIRSLQQNARLWALYTAISRQAPAHMGGVWYSPQVWHGYAKTRFLGMESGPYGMGVPKSTTRLTVGEFGDYMAEVEAWAYSEFEGFKFEYEEAA